MISRIASVASLLFVVLASTPDLCAQRGGAEEETPRFENELQRKRWEKAQKAAGEMGDLPEGDMRKMTPEERLERGTRRGARGHCRFVASVRPPKLLPGQSGTVLVTAILQGRAVLPAPSQVELLTMPNNNGAVQVGTLLPPAPENGVLHDGYKGRAVYENTATFEVPITMGSQAELGSKEAVNFDLKFDIYDGQTARVIGRFLERISAEIEVAPYSEPEVAGRRSEPKPAEPVVAPDSAPRGQEPAPDDGAGTAGGGDAALGGSTPTVPAANEVDPEPAPPKASSSGEDLAPSAKGGGLPVPLLFGGAAILIVIVLLLARRK